MFLFLNFASTSQLQVYLFDYLSVPWTTWPKSKDTKESGWDKNKFVISPAIKKKQN